MSTKLSLRIHSVKCVDETGGYWAERVGNDEIYLGGFTILPNGQSQKISATSVYADFDDGDIKRFDPPKVFATFNLGPNFNRAKNYAAGLILVERDSGNMSTAINSLYEEVKRQVVRATTPVTTGGGAGVATAVDPATLVAIWTVIKPYVYGYVRNLVSAWVGDEIFPMQDVSATLLNSNHTWNGQKTSPIAMKEFRGHGGVYQVYYDWHLS